MKLILVVEDEYGHAEILKLLLESSGYRVASAPNGRAALALLAGEKPALILSDFMMPHFNGAELGEAVRGDATLRDIPFVMMSGTSLDVVRQSFRHYDAFLAKPYDNDVLLKVIEDLVANGRPKKTGGPASEEPAKEFLKGLGLPPT